MATPKEPVADDIDSSYGGKPMSPASLFTKCQYVVVAADSTQCADDLGNYHLLAEFVVPHTWRGFDTEQEARDYLDETVQAVLDPDYLLTEMDGEIAAWYLFATGSMAQIVRRFVDGTRTFRSGREDEALKLIFLKQLFPEKYFPKGVPKARVVPKTGKVVRRRKVKEEITPVAKKVTKRNGPATPQKSVEPSLTPQRRARKGTTAGNGSPEGTITPKRKARR